MMLINGEERTQLDATDRGLQYGDGLFETLAVRDGAPEHWERHLRRMHDGAQRLGIPVPDPQLLAEEAARVCHDGGRGVLKIILTRGAGGRGYRSPVQPTPTRVLSLHPWPDYPADHAEQGVRLRLCRTALGLNPALAGIKHLNRLEQVLARSEWDDADIAEGLMLDSDGRLVCGTMSNLFLVRDGELYTPELTRCGVEGTTRARVLETAADHGIRCHITDLQLDALWGADEVFVCNSIIGVWPARQVEQHSYTCGPVTRRCIQWLSATDGS